MAIRVIDAMRILARRVKRGRGGGADLGIPAQINDGSAHGPDMHDLVPISRTSSAFAVLPIPSVMKGREGSDVPLPMDTGVRSGGDPAESKEAVRAIVPVAGRVTSRLGMRTLGGKTRRHNAVDIACPVGTPVRASMAGRVSFAGAKSGYGLVVYLQHPNGVESRYAHLSAIHVSAGQEIGAGAVIGLSGNTGQSTGPHLHWEVRVNGSPVDPMSMVG